MNPKKPMPQGVRTAITALNTALIVLGVLMIALLAAGTLKARSDGTFSLFGRSFHLNQSEQMSPVVEKSDLVVIREMSPTSFQMGNLIAYYQQEDDKNYLIIRELVCMVGSDYYLEDGQGNQTVVAADTTQFLGRVEARSARLGLAVQFLQSKEGKSIYLWWTGSLLFLLMGVVILLHVILKNAGTPQLDDDADYGVRYFEAPEAAEELSEPEEEPAFQQAEPMPDVAGQPEAEPLSQESPFDFDFGDVLENVSENGSDGEAALGQEAVVAAPVDEMVEDDFDLSGIISDIQAQLDREDQ